jgi:hypothetical protein
MTTTVASLTEIRVIVVAVISLVLAIILQGSLSLMEVNIAYDTEDLYSTDQSCCTTPSLGSDTDSVSSFSD